MTTTRRQFTQHVLGGVALCGAMPALLARRSNHSASDDYARIAALVRGCGSDLDTYRMLAAEQQKGTPLAVLLGGIFLVGLEDLYPGTVGGRLHPVLMVESSFQIAEAVRPEERILAVMFNAHRYKSQVGRVRDDGLFGPCPVVEFESAEEARREVAESFAKFDLERGERAVVGALAHLELDELFEEIWPFGVRDFNDVGHRVIFTAHIHRVLKRLNGDLSVPALRSLAHGLLGNGAGAETDGYAECCELAGAMRDDWREGDRDPSISPKLTVLLRDLSPQGAAREVARLSAAGVAPEPIWDALRLFSAEMLAREPQLITVHGQTATNAMGYVFRTTRRDHTARVALLQAAAWMPTYREAFGVRNGLKMIGPSIDELTPADPTIGIDKLFELADEDPAKAARHVLALENTGSFLSGTRTFLLRRATGSHHTKYAAAVIEDAALCHPRWRRHVLSSCVHYLPFGPGQSEPYRQMRKA